MKGCRGAGHEPELVFSTPAGNILAESLYPQFPHISAETSASALRCQAPTVTTTTCTPNWQGENCDYGMAVDGLLQRDA